MITVIVDMRRDPDRAPELLAQLTAGAVEGVTREVILVGADDAFMAALREETGADLADTFDVAVARARYDWILGADASYRFREGWIEAVARFLAGPRKAALVRGQGAWLLGGPVAVLVERSRAVGARDVRGLRGQLRLRPARIA